MSSGGRKRSGSTGGSAKKAKSMTPYKPKKSKTYKAKYPKTVYLPLFAANGAIGPTRIRTRLRYAGLYTSTTSSGSSSSPVVFRMNSIYDPEVAIGGGQPYGMDQIVNMGYNKYIVRGYKLEVWPASRGPIGGAVGSHAVSFQTVGTGGALNVSYASAMMRGFKHKTIQYQVNGTGANGCDTPQGGFKDGYIKKFWRIKDVIGRPQDDVEDSAVINADPSQVCLVSVCADVNPVSASIAFVFYAKMTYYVDFFNAVSVANS